jgi:methionyl-tRNA formyltransferase
MNYPSVLPQSVIDVFPFGILNIHPGDLPRYRGNACQAWALLQGEARLAACVHRMIGGEIDSGDIVSRSYLDVDLKTKVGQAWRWLFEIAPVLVVDALEKLQANPTFAIERQSTNPADALRCYPRTPDDGRIQWDRPALEVLRLINASGRPYAGAFCQLDAERMVVWEAELGNTQELFLAVPGQITRIGGEHVEVACREGMVRLTEVELKGEVAPPSRFIRSLRTRLA